MNANTTENEHELKAQAYDALCAIQEYLDGYDGRRVHRDLSDALDDGPAAVVELAESLDLPYAEDDARTAVKRLSEGDVIRVPQYKNALKVVHTGELNGEPNAFIGIEFVQNPTGSQKHMIVNQYSDKVYLVAGSTDKGEVETIETVTSPAGEGR